MGRRFRHAEPDAAHPRGAQRDSVLGLGPGRHRGQAAMWKLRASHPEMPRQKVPAEPSGWCG